MGERPEFCARAMGMASSAFAKARIAYCSRPGVYRTGLLRFQAKGSVRK